MTRRLEGAMIQAAGALWVACAGLCTPACSDERAHDGAAAVDAARSDASSETLGEAGAGGAGSDAPAGQGGVGGAGAAAGSAGSPWGNGIPGDCSLTVNEALCSKCLQTRCFDVCVVLEDEPTAQDYMDCILGCFDTDCVEACEQSYSSAATALHDLNSCLHMSCPWACGAGVCSVSTDSLDCNDCINETCGEACADMETSPDFNAWTACRQSCSDQACEDSCGLAFPNTSGYFELLVACIEERCTADCEGAY